MGQKSCRGLRGSRRAARNGKTSAQKCRCSKLSLETLEQRQLLSVNPIISEFMASNSTALVDYYGKNPDWLEIYNPDPATLNLAGWKLKENSTVWTIPANVTIPGLSYLKIFCDQRDTIAPNGELHTSFKLGASGDYLGLLKPDNTVVSEYAPEYPQQFTDISYGLVLEGQSTPIISSGAAAKAFVPTDSNGGSGLGDAWKGSLTNDTFDDSSWQSGTTGVGMPVTMTPIAAASLKLRLNADASGTVVADTSGSLHNGTNSGVSWVASSTDSASEPLSRAGAMQFNASESDRVSVPSNTDFSNATEGAIMFWMRSSGTSGTSGDGAVLLDYRATSGMLISQANAGQIRVRTFYSSTAVNDITSNVSVSDNLWHHVTVAFNQGSEGTCEIYIDGVLDTQGANPRSWSWATTNPLEIGRCALSHTPSLTMKSYNGLLDDVRFYSAAVTPSQIADIAKGVDENVNASEVGLDLTPSMQGVNSSAFLRIPFNVADASAIHDLLLSIRFNDGFAAWINGVQVAGENAPDTPAWNSAATDIHSSSRMWRGLIDDVSDLLRNGTNILAIQGLNYSASDPSFFLMPQLSANVTSIYGTNGRYFVTPTPGNVNGSGSIDLAPVVTEVSHPAAQPAAGDPIVVTARVTQTISPIQTDSVALHYKVMYNTSEPTVRMYDDGTHGDAHAGDGVFTGTIPGGIATAGQMVRWYVTANDTLAHAGRWPLKVPIIGNDGGPEYEGTVIADPSLVSTLPIIQLFVSNTSASDTTTGTRCSVFCLGEFYDNVFIRHRGMYSTNGNKIEFNSGYDFKFAEDRSRVKEINLNQQSGGLGIYDDSYSRPTVAFETLRDSGVPASLAFPVRLQRNGAYYTVVSFIEQFDKNLLRREGLYENAAVYKSYTDTMSSASNFEKKNRDEIAGTADLQQFLNGLHLSDATARRKFIYDNVDIAEVIDYLAANALILDNDQAAKNFFIYCDTNDGANAVFGNANPKGTNLWGMAPWDKDLTFGKNYGFSDYSTTDPQAHPFFGDSEHPKIDGPVNWLTDVLLDIPEIKQLYLRRLRTLMDELLQPPGTADTNCYFENRFDELYARLMGDPVFASQQYYLQYYFDDIKTRYLDARRQHLYVDHLVGSGYPGCAGIPLAQAENLVVNFGSYEVSPASGNQDQEYRTLVNPNNFAIDLSGWKLTGGINLTFKEGVVIPANGTLYVSPNEYQFRKRTTGPSGNQGLLVTGNYGGYLSLQGESVQLLDLKDNVVATLTTPSTPSLAQQFLRVTEVMYHPADPPGGSSYINDDFQFIELKNTSTTQTLSLAGVRFADGVAFDFTGSGVTSLAPGARALVVSNLAAFQSRYGTGLNSIIAGQFAKTVATDLTPSRLAKSGEKLTLVDAVGETILSFSYQDDWFKQTDGAGNSLVVRDATAADRALWDQSEGWFASHSTGGSPGADETTAYAANAIVVNELLSHRTDEPNALGDWVEFYNATDAPIDIGGWFLSNDDANLKKFRVAAGTIIPAHGYKAFNWRDHFGSTANAGCLAAFTLGELGGNVYLTSAVSDALTDFQASEKFGSSDTGITLGRYLKSTGGKDFVAMSSPTYEAANSAPLVGPVVINEIYYHPATGKDAFIELKNISGAAVSLYDPAHPENTWHLAEGVELTFPAGASIPAGGYALIVNIDPAYYRTKYGIPASVPIFGPYLFELNKSGDTIELKYADDPQPDGEVPYDRMDQVTYSDGGLWPKSADGFGASLSRATAVAYGNDAANWSAGWPTPGAENMAFVANPLTLITPATATLPTGSRYLDISAYAITAGGDASSLIYSWTVTSKPSGVSNPYIFSNGTFEASNTQAYLYGPGSYTFTVSISSTFGASITSSVSINVVPTISKLSLLPSTPVLSPGSQQQFIAFFSDQFDNRYSSQPTDISWSATSGSITADGMFTAPNTAGTVAIDAQSGSFYGSTTVQVSNPQGYWKFNETSGTTAADSSGNGYAGTLTSGCTWTTSGLFGGGLNFNGSSGRVTANINTSESAFGISFWFKTTSPNVGLFEVSDGSTSRDRCIYLSGGYLYAYLYSDETVSGYMNLADGKWHNVTYTYGNEYYSQMLFVDGILNAYGSKGQSDFNWDNRIYIGYTDFASQPYFSGTMDDVRIYNIGLPYPSGPYWASVPPTNIALSAATVAENQSGVNIGTLTTTDVNTRDTYFYTLSNDPTGKFEISGSTLKLKEGQSLDFEATPSVALTIRTYNSAAQYFEKTFTISVTNVSEAMVVTPADWTAAGLTIQLGTDGKLHAYRTGTAIDAVPPHLPAKVTGIQIVGRSDADDELTVDFGNGNPIPTGGFTFDGGSQQIGDALFLRGTPNNDSVALTGTQVTLSGTPAIGYANIEYFGFDLAAGVNSLLVDHATLKIDRDGGISNGTKVTVDGGVLDYNGKSLPIGDLTLKNHGHVTATTIENTTTTVESGTLTATSIVCDTLVIGSSSTAAASAKQETAPAAALTKNAAEPLEVGAIAPVSDEKADDPVAAVASAMPLSIASPAVPHEAAAALQPVQDIAIVKIETGIDIPPQSRHDWILAYGAIQSKIIEERISNAFSKKSMVENEARASLAKDAGPDQPESVAQRISAATDDRWQIHLAILQSVMNEHRENASEECSEFDNIPRKHARKQTLSTEAAVDLVLALDEMFTED